MKLLAFLLLAQTLRRSNAFHRHYEVYEPGTQEETPEEQQPLPESLSEVVFPLEVTTLPETHLEDLPPLMGNVSISQIRVFELKGLGNHFRISLALFDDFIPSDLMIEYPIYVPPTNKIPKGQPIDPRKSPFKPKPSTTSKPKTKPTVKPVAKPRAKPTSKPAAATTKAPPPSYTPKVVRINGTKLFKGCIYSGVAINLMRRSNTLGRTEFDKGQLRVILNLCKGMRGGIITDMYQYEIEPLMTDPSQTLNRISGAPHRMTKTLLKKDSKCVQHVSTQEYIPSWSFPSTSPRLTPSGNTRNSLVYTMELTIFAQMEDGRPNSADILAVAALAAQNLAHHSMGAKIQLIVNNIIFIQDNQFLASSGGDLLDIFSDFAAWYQTQYPNVYWDAAGLLTSRINEAYELGIAPVPGTCNSVRNTFVSDYDGIGSSATFTHDLGHMLGAYHDIGNDIDAKECLSYDSRSPRGIMAYHPQANERYRWSTCSRHFIYKFLASEEASCLLELTNKRPLTISPYPSKMPGGLICKSLNPDYDCNYAKSTCKDMYCGNEMEEHWLSITLDGTPCEGNKLSEKASGSECVQGKCVKSKKP